MFTVTVILWICIIIMIIIDYATVNAFYETRGSFQLFYSESLSAQTAGVGGGASDAPLLERVQTSLLSEQSTFEPVDILSSLRLITTTLTGKLKLQHRVAELDCKAFGPVYVQTSAFSF